MKWLQSVGIILLLLAAPMAILYPVWLNPVSAEEDDLVYYYPLRKMVGQSLREGRWPTANRLEATGSVLMADPQSAVLFPPTWLFAVLEAKLAYSLSIFLAFAVAGWGTFAYLRRLGLVRAAAVFGAFAMMFCGFLVGHRVHLSILHAASMLPWGLWCIESLRHRRARAAAWMAIAPVAYLTITAGHWPTLIHMSLIWLAYLCLRGRPFVRSALLGGSAAVVGALAAGPQILLTAQLLARATRQRIGYAMAGENSFFPTSVVHALFPMLMGSRTPNFYPQRWWGAWHLCEMLGYVGLATLVFAALAVWRIYRKPKADRNLPPTADSFRPLVRVWTWMFIGAGVWMLGYYLPTYRLIHRLPVLGVVRCPARMILAADMALVTLASIWVHVLLCGSSDAATSSLRRSTRRAVTRVLPVVMLATLAVVGLCAAVVWFFWPGGIGTLGFIVGGSRDALRALVPTNPAVWVPLAMMVATIGAVRFWLARPRGRADVAARPLKWPGRPGHFSGRVVVLVGVLVIDLFFVAGFVDVQGAGRVGQDPDASPAAAWLWNHAPADPPFRVWGLSGDLERFGLAGSYHHRGAELLLPKTCEAMGLATINSYGPFQSPAHARLFGFRIFGTTRGWADLLRRNYPLSLYGVRYVIASDRRHREVLESVRIPAGGPPRDGPELIAEKWDLKNAELRGGNLWLRTPVLWRTSEAWQRMRLEPQAVYRIRLEARGPEGGAANFLQADYFEQADGRWYSAEGLQLIAHAEQIGTDWRRFEWTFRCPRKSFGEAGQTFLRVFTMSERPIEVRAVSLRRSHWPVPANLGNRLAPGRGVYAKRAELGALNAGDARVVIYENLLWSPARATVSPEAARIEAFRQAPESSGEVPDVSLHVDGDPSGLLYRLTLPAGGVYLVVGVAIVILRRRRGIREHNATGER